MSDDFKIQGAEWELSSLIPDPLPLDWDVAKLDVLHSTSPRFLTAVRGKADTFKLDAIRAVVEQRTAVSHFYCSVNGPESVVSVIAIRDHWWVMNEYTTWQVYGDFETPLDVGSYIGFQELIWGTLRTCPSKLVLERDTAIAIAARVALGETTVPFVEVPGNPGTAEWLATMDPMWYL